jgi:titin
LKVVEYNTDHMLLSWKAPAHDGGSSILGYVVEKRDTFMNLWSQVGRVDKDTLGIRATGLFEGQSYLFRVAAENQCGRGEFVETVKPVTAKLPFGK